MKNFVIVGNSAAAVACIEAIRQKDSVSKITVISDENYSSYCRCLISYYLAGDVKEDKLVYRGPDFYRENNVELILNKKVERVDPKKNRVILEDKNQIGYDELLIATGARPKFPETKGIKRKGVFGFRTLKDAKDIDNMLAVTKTACVLGGGLIGLKAAYALKKRNIEVKVIVKSGQVLSQMLDAESAAMVKKRLQEHGVEVMLGEDAAEIIGEGDVKAVKLESGKVFGCSLVIVAKGVAPNIDLIKETSVEVNEGILANNLLQTSVANIYAAGDVCENFDLTSGKAAVNALWPIAVEQGKAAGANMSGEKLEYGGSLGMNSLEFFGLAIISLGIYKVSPVRNIAQQDGNAGISNGVSPDQRSAVEEFKFHDPKSNLYKKLILKNKVLIGAILVGDIKNSGVFLRLIREKINVSPFQDKMLQENFGFPDIIEFVRDKEKMYV